MTGPNTEPAFDPAAAGPQPSAEEIERAARDSVKSGVDIRSRIHDITLLALRNRRFDRQGMQEVVKAVTKGMANGAEQSQADFRQSLSEAFRGMDHALSRSAEAGGSALRQLAATGKDLSNTEIKQAIAQMKRLQDDFLATAGHAAEATSERIRPELRKIRAALLRRVDRHGAGRHGSRGRGRLPIRASGERNPGRHRRRTRDSERQEAAVKKPKRCCSWRSARCGTCRVCRRSRRS
jgi:hypothetical protein